MKLRELKKGRFAASLTWGGGADDPRRPRVIDASGATGVLVDVLAGAAVPELVDARTGTVKNGVLVVMEQAGTQQREVLEWDGPANAPTPEQVTERLRPHTGTRIGGLGEVEIGEA